MRDTGLSSSTGFEVSRMMLLGRAHTSLYPGCRSQSSLTAGPVHVMCQSSLVAKVHHAILLQFLSDCCSLCLLLCLFFNVYLILSLSASQYVLLFCCTNKTVFVPLRFAECEHHAKNPVPTSCWTAATDFHEYWRGLWWESAALHHHWGSEGCSGEYQA